MNARDLSDGKARFSDSCFSPYLPSGLKLGHVQHSYIFKTTLNANKVTLWTIQVILATSLPTLSLTSAQNSITTFGCYIGIEEEARS